MKTKTALAMLALTSLLTLQALAQITVATVDYVTGLNNPFGVVMDGGNTLYVADSANHRILRVDVNSQDITTLAGIPGESGANDGPAYLAHFDSPQGIVLAIWGGTNGLVVADTGNNTIRFVNIANGEVVTLAGQAGVAGSAANAPGATATFNQPTGLALDSDNTLYIADSANGAIRTIHLSDPILGVTNIVVAGTTFSFPTAIAIVSTTQFWVADTFHNAVKLITLTGADTGTITTVVGSDNSGVHGTADNSFGSLARFYRPRGLLWLGGNAGLLISDTDNHSIRQATNYAVFGATNYAVKTFAGMPGQSGLLNGDVLAAKFNRPMTLARDLLNNGFLVVDWANNALRRIQFGPPQERVGTPQIGWVDFVDTGLGFVSILRTDQPFVFNNDVIIAILSEQGTETFFTYGPTPPSPLEDPIPSPNRETGTTPPLYRNGLSRSEVQPSIVLPQPDVTIKAISVQDGRANSTNAQARFQFRVANPNIQGDNAASFIVTDTTAGATMWYTLDGSDPTNAAPSKGPISTGASLSLNAFSNITFKIRAFRDRFKSSDAATRIFSPSNFIPNRITFGFEGGEASSDFIGAAGQIFYAPVTLSILPGTKMYSLQFNVTVTNVGSSPPVAPGAVGFQSTLVKPDPVDPGIFWIMPPSMFLTLITNEVVTTDTNGVMTTNFVANPIVDPPPTNNILHPFGYNPTLPFLDLRFVNSSLNLIGVGWLERRGQKNLYDTTVQDLIKYSQPHDTVFLEDDNKIVTGAYGFVVPPSATGTDSYRIQIGRPSATSDGIGAPGSDVFIDTPTTGSLTNGAMNSIKNVRIGLLKYIAGDAAPFRWYNAGDFGNNTLLDDDVMQVFQSAIYFLNGPPLGSDFFDGMDSCCDFGVTNAGTGYFTDTGFGLGGAGQNPLYDGDDTVIDRIAFGDGELNVTDVYVTFRRSLDPSRVWYRRFWTNGFRAAELTTNVFRPSGGSPDSPVPSYTYSPDSPAVSFACTDVVATAGQTIQVPIKARIQGGYPLRVLMLGLTVQPLDGSPALTDAVQFTPNPALGTPTVTSARGLANYAAAWLNSYIAGLTGTSTIGILTIKVPASATGFAAYAVHFDHASASPNGIAVFPEQVRSGLVTLADRSGSSFNDGIPDSWRLRWFGTVNNLLSGADADADGDGASNWHEYKAGTDPNDVKSILRLGDNAAAGPECVVKWPTIADKQYVIEKSATMFAPDWIPVSTNAGTGWEMEYHDTSPTAGACFYRVRVLE